MSESKQQLWRVAIATFSAPPQCDPRRAFLLTRTISTKFPSKQKNRSTLTNALLP